MKRSFWIEFCRRGTLAAAGGPAVLAIIYAILGANGTAEHLTSNEVCLGILTSILLAFVAAGSGAVYTLEQLPMGMAALIQGLLLYADYILIYFINGWLKTQWRPVLIFTACFLSGYALIWLVIYCVTKSKTERANRKLSENKEE